MTGLLSPARVDKEGVVVITGGARGFGLNVAERFVRAGVRVAILDVSTDELAIALENLKKLSPGGASFVLGVQCNVTNSDECVSAAASVAAAFPGVEISFLFVSLAFGLAGTWPN
jgi:NAD(P)-dependent dehydrogenase (short-subunit alcohol dehydrogenase family)